MKKQLSEVALTVVCLFGSCLVMAAVIFLK